MNDFEQLEKELARASVELDEPDVNGAGTLDLAREKTLAVLATDRSLRGRG
jgi:hypothetical protein